MNKFIGIGFISKKPEITTTTNGVSVCKFTLAVQRRYTNESGEREADFINVVAWRNLADVVHKHTDKGSKVAVIGSLQIRSYDANDGTKRYVTEVVADEVEFISTKDNKEEVSKVGLTPLEDSSDLPF